MQVIHTLTRSLQSSVFITSKLKNNQEKNRFYPVLFFVGITVTTIVVVMSKRYALREI